MNQVTDKAAEVFAQAAKHQPLQTAMLMTLLALFLTDMWFDHQRYKTRVEASLPLLQQCIGKGGAANTDRPRSD